MCGIAGILSNNETTLAAAAEMINVLRHRGPDDGDTWNDPTAGVALGHRRLAIVDLSPAGHQPMHSDCGRYVLTYNGEIYNHQELRSSLRSNDKKGPWRGHSDTETLLACCAAWGVKRTLERAVGMFAFGLWDRTERRLWLARDRFGEKPLYYGWVGKSFAFASELEAIRQVPGFSNPVDRNAIALFLQFNYVPAPYSIYRNVFKLEAGCLLSLQIEDANQPPSAAPTASTNQGSFCVETYWSFPAVAQRGLVNLITNERDAVDELAKVLGAAVRRQSVADVPLGAFLSGGIDSSTIVALMQAQATRPVKTFTIGFADEAYDEAPFARAIAQHLGTDHAELRITSAEAQAVIPRLGEIYSEPFADASQIPTFLVSQMARQHVTVSLSGDAGDELFAGYNRYFWSRRIWRRLRWMPGSARRMLGGMITTLPATVWDRLGNAMPSRLRTNRFGDKAHKLATRLQTVDSLDDLYRSLVSEWAFESNVVHGASRLSTLLDRSELVAPRMSEEERMMVWDTMTYLTDDILQKVDRAAMAVSLESRVPLLDSQVVELAWRIPLGMKIREGKGKWVLRQVLERYVPRQLTERPKSGFGLPIGVWLRGPLRDWSESLLSTEALESTGLLNAPPVRKKWMEHLSGSRDWTASLWGVLMLQSWLATSSAPALRSSVGKTVGRSR